MKVRAKFRCVWKVEIAGGGCTLHMSAVTSGSPENEKFFNATPFGELDMGTVNPAAAAQFEEGKEYYLDFTHAPTREERIEAVRNQSEPTPSPALEPEESTSVESSPDDVTNFEEPPVSKNDQSPNR